MCLYLKMDSQSSVQFSVSLLPWRSRLGLTLSLPVSAFLDLAAASYPLFRWKGHRAPFGERWGCISVLLGIGIAFFPASTQQLYYIEYFYVPGIVLCSARTKVASAGATPVFGQDPGGMFHHITPFLNCVPQPHSHFRI